MEKDKMQLDRERFAYTVASNFHPDDKDDLLASKAVLRRYLVAYYLADQFNKLEDCQFQKAKGWDFSLLTAGLDQINLH